MGIATVGERNLLVPQRGVEEMMGGGHVGPGRAMLSALVQRFLVSPGIAAIALEQSGCIARATKEEWKSVSTAINQARLLIGVLGPISTPETVEGEVLRKSKTDPRFRAVEREWSKLTRKYIDVLSDDWPELESVLHRPAGIALAG